MTFRTLNLDLLICVIENAPKDDTAFLRLLGRTCRSARGHNACVQAVRRARLLSLVQESRQAVLMDAAVKHLRTSNLSELTARLSKSHRSLHDYLRRTYGLTRKFRASTPKNRVGSYRKSEPSFRLYDAWIGRHPSTQHAACLVSDLFFLARHNYTVDVYYYMKSTPQQMETHLADPFVALLRTTDGVRAEDNIHDTRRYPWSRTFKFHIAATETAQIRQLHP